MVIDGPFRLLASEGHKYGGEKPSGNNKKLCALDRTEETKPVVICRMRDERLIKITAFGRTDGKAVRGRPQREWLDDITDWCDMELHQSVYWLKPVLVDGKLSRVLDPNEQSPTDCWVDGHALSTKSRC